MYTRDRAALLYAWMKTDKEALAAAPLGSIPDPVHEEAQRRFYATYQLPEFEGEPMHPAALADFVEHWDSVPKWILSQLSPQEIEEVNHARKRRHAAR